MDSETIGAGDVPDSARKLHTQARQEGAAGNYEKAIQLLNEASKEAPSWPYPVYDLAFTYLLKGDAVTALQYYEAVDRMSPRGFFTAKTAVDSLRREESGGIKPGTYLQFVMLEWAENRAQKRADLERILHDSPAFPPAWKELSVLLDDDNARLAAIDKGLSFEPDGETKGILVVNKALILDRRGEQTEATRLLDELALDPNSTLATEQIAKAALAQVTSVK